MVRFTVLRGDGEWRMICDGRGAGHFDYSGDAIEAALVRAATLLNRGQAVEVLVEDTAGRLHAVAPVGGEILR